MRLLVSANIQAILLTTFAILTGTINPIIAIKAILPNLVYPGYLENTNKREKIISTIRIAIRAK
jgi:uncharacterized membrane protein